MPLEHVTGCECSDVQFSLKTVALGQILGLRTLLSAFCSVWTWFGTHGNVLPCFESLAFVTIRIFYSRCFRKSQWSPRQTRCCTAAVMHFPLSWAILHWCPSRGSALLCLPLLIPLRFLTIYFINLKANKDVPDRKKNKKRKEKERKETGEMAPWLEHWLRLQRTRFNSQHQCGSS